MGKAASIAVRSLTPNRPYHVQWMLTRKCNYRCRGCNVWRDQDSKELSTKDVLKGLDILKNLGVFEVVLSGGNPLLRDDIGEIIEYASKRFITSVYDNGSMAIKKIDELRKADFVAISIDSLNPEKNDYLRGVKGALEMALKAIKILKEQGIVVSVSPTISQFNLYEIADLTKYFINRGIPLWYCMYSYDFSCENQIFKIGKKTDEFIITDKNGIISLCDEILELSKHNKNILITSQLLKAIKNLYSSNKRTWKCRALKNFLVVDHLGRVSGCHLYDPIGSIFDLPHIWRKRKTESLRKKYSECVRCNYLCYIFYSIHGSIWGNVQIAKEQIKNSRLLLKSKT